MNTKTASGVTRHRPTVWHTQMKQLVKHLALASDKKSQLQCRLRLYTTVSSSPNLLKLLISLPLCSFTKLHILCIARVNIFICVMCPFINWWLTTNRQNKLILTFGNITLLVMQSMESQLGPHMLDENMAPLSTSFRILGSITVEWSKTTRLKEPYTPSFT